MNLAASRSLVLLVLTSFVGACGSDTVDGSDGEVADILEVDTLEAEAIDEVDELDVAPEVEVLDEVDEVDVTEVVIVAPSFGNLPGAVDTEVGAAGTFLVDVVPSLTPSSAVHVPDALHVKETSSSTVIANGQVVDTSDVVIVCAGESLSFTVTVNEPVAS